MSKLPLNHKRIAIAGGRRFAELESIINKLGGEALNRPMMSSSSNDNDEVTTAIKTLASQKTDWVILVTGIGTKALLNKANELNQDLFNVLQNSQIAARGYKTVKALKELALKPEVQDDDGTIEGLKRQLERFDFKNKRVTVQLHGERMPELTDWLTQQGAHVLEIPLYFYDPPAEQAVQTLLYETLSGRIDAIAFTSNTQVKFFFQAVKKLNALPYLEKALHETVIALSVGSMTSQALRNHNIKRIVAPEHERMGAMVMALAEHYQKEGRRKKEEFSSYPIVLTQLHKVVIVGGGKVAERKAKALIEAKVKPTLISPDLTEELQVLKQESKLEHIARSYTSADLHHAELIIAATNHPEVNVAIATQARQNNSLCNVVDAPELGNFTTLGTIRKGDLTIALSTNGKSPSLNRFLSEKLEQQFPESYAILLNNLAKKRPQLTKLNTATRNAVLENLTQTNILEQLAQNPKQADELCQTIINLYSPLEHLKT